jgi:methylphosphotriester-DNA--protein-cysteine methyltransferase
VAHAYQQSWETAWRTRDPAFDGRLFIGVRSTGVYCRCVCPVKLPLRRNIDFYPRAAAAEAAGFRPCPRCRPETAPFCPAWKGTLTTVERAARLISEEGALDNEGQSVDALAERLGVTMPSQALVRSPLGRSADGRRKNDPRPAGQVVIERNRLADD